MAEYIEREDAVSALDVAEEFLRRLAAADVVEVIRCKDCKSASVRRYEFNGEIYSTFCNRRCEKMKEDDFCSNGERRNGDV